MTTITPYVSPDISKTVFSAPDTHYSFHQPSHIFSGENTTFMSPDVGEGACIVVAKFNYAGELEHGTIKIVGGISSASIPPNTVLLQGTIVNVDSFSPESGGVFRVNFLFKIDVDHPWLDYDSHLGVWNAYMVMPGWPDHFYRYLFRRNWGPESAPLNSYIGQVKSIV